MTRATSQTGSQNSPAPAAADVRVELVSNPAYLCAMREMVGVICKRTGFVDAVASKVVLAVDEALANETAELTASLDGMWAGDWEDD